MEIKGVTRRDIEAALPKLGDYVKMEYLTKCLKQNIDFDTRKFALTKLAQIYESKGMFSDAAKLMTNAADISPTYDGKMNDFMKAVDLHAKAGKFDEADAAFNKALVCASGIQKDRLKEKRKEIYRAQAKSYMDKDKRKNAMLAYEKMLNLDISNDERKQVQTILIGLYEKLGKIREFYALKRNMDNPTVQQQQPQPKVFESRRSSSDFILDL
ncbi:hypothetical protein KW787_03705 [Candidatus Pacearchaeota archaeon]|nr:hypothetical protein [Candidatus Pacearchaeota archaeon]